MDANLQGGGYAAGGQVGLTPEVKQAVADEVRRQLEMERAEGQSMTMQQALAYALQDHTAAHAGQKP